MDAAGKLRIFNGARAHRITFYASKPANIASSAVNIGAALAADQNESTGADNRCQSAFSYDVTVFIQANLNAGFYFTVRNVDTAAAAD